MHVDGSGPMTMEILASTCWFGATSLTATNLMAIGLQPRGHAEASYNTLKTYLQRERLVRQEQARLASTIITSSPNPRDSTIEGFIHDR